MTNLDYPIVIDNILPSKKFFAIRDEFKYVGWTLSNKSFSNDQYISWGWKKELNRANKLCFYDAGTFIKLKIQKYLKTNLIYIRSHVNGQTSGQVSKFHTDYHRSGTYTVVVFTEKSWDTQWGGEFVFCDKDNNDYKYITYIPNRGVLIPANYEHYGMSPNHFTSNLRTSVAFSYIKEKDLHKVLNKNSTNEARYFVGPTHGNGF